ncbi:MAG: hypothetical protein M3065_07735 [Actinomycetota bacterium]|nr:hypothetical protein [Actinomycetota bacterium]
MFVLERLPDIPNDTNRKGAVAEIEILLAAMKLGVPVLKPVASTVGNWIGRSCCPRRGSRASIRCTFVCRRLATNSEHALR